MADTPATAFDAWFDVHMRGQIVSDLYRDDLWCAYQQGCADEREACAQLVESQKELRSSSWHASRIRARGTT